MRELLGQRQCHARRIAIDFPRMNDDCNGNAAAVALGDRSEDPRRVAHPKAPADPQWDVLPEAAVDERRELDDLAVRGRPHVRPLRIRRIADDPHRRHARVEREPSARQHVEGPRRSPVDRPLGRAKASHVGDARGGKRRAALREIGAEAFGRQLVHAPMEMSMRGDFMAGPRDITHERRMPRGDPAEHEERRARSARVEQAQHIARCFDDAARQPIPVLESKRTADAANVEPLLDVDGQAVAHWPRGYPVGCRDTSMNSTMVRTLCSTRLPTCSSLISTPNERCSSRTISSASIESRPSPSSNSGMSSWISAGVIGIRRHRTIAVFT